MKTKFIRSVSYLCLTIIAGMFIIMLVFKPTKKHDENFSQSMQLYILAKSYKHQSELFADSAVNYSGPEVKDRIQIWIKGAKADDSLYNALADSAKLLLTK